MKSQITKTFNVGICQEENIGKKIIVKRIENEMKDSPPEVVVSVFFKYVFN